MSKNKGGRPKREMSDDDFDKVIEAVKIQCTQEEICSIFKMDHKTLDRILKERGESGFSQFYKKHQDFGRKSLRRAQWEAATKDKNPTMLVWLGKQHLGQRDKHDVEGNFTINLPAAVRQL